MAVNLEVGLVPFGQTTPAQLGGSDQLPPRAGREGGKMVEVNQGLLPEEDLKEEAALGEELLLLEVASAYRPLVR